MKKFRVNWDERHSIVVEAKNKEEARKVAEQVNVELKRRGSRLDVRIEKPELPQECWVAVDLKIIVPKQTNIKCASSRGSTEIADIKGNVKGRPARSLFE